eukprot:scaffold559376_cov17-Prasinocladus_malaysianus.AAC.1
MLYISSVDDGCLHAHYYLRDISESASYTYDTYIANLGSNYDNRLDLRQHAAAKQATCCCLEGPTSCCKIAELVWALDAASLYMHRRGVISRTLVASSSTSPEFVTAGRGQTADYAAAGRARLLDSRYILLPTDFVRGSLSVEV